MNMSSRANVHVLAPAALLLLFYVPAIFAAETKLIKQGRDRYENDCVSCHGLSARGDGAVAEILTIAPADLTVLSRGNGGEFPEDHVKRVIDGRDLPPAVHGKTAMPVWGMQYKRTLPGYSEEVVQRKINALVAYLRSIQVE